MILLNGDTNNALVANVSCCGALYHFENGKLKKYAKRYGGRQVSCGTLPFHYRSLYNVNYSTLFWVRAKVCAAHANRGPIYNRGIKEFGGKWGCGVVLLLSGCGCEVLLIFCSDSIWIFIGIDVCYCNRCEIIGFVIEILCVKIFFIFL